ncbi:MAG: DUF4886 domain-containing protein [Ruminococcaceae bacterium]|nr:DUF4886 domain-containing protein [Oscillospiraceae bacterium]
MLKILSIGNSFSHNAQTYLYQLGYADRVPMKTANLYIGGCSLETHYNNMKSSARVNPFYLNGNSTGLITTIEEALKSDDWTVVTLQQASHFSAKAESYYPYINELAEYVRTVCPHAKLYIHQTWGYADGSKRLAEQGFNSMEEMSKKVFECYNLAAEKINADGIIPSGEAMLELNKLWDKDVHADTFHAATGLPTYLLAQVWFRTLTGSAPLGLHPEASFEKITENEARLAADIARRVTGI